MLRTHLPNSIRLSTGETLTPYIGALSRNKVIEYCKKEKIKYRLIEVLGRNLRDRTDLHGRPYKATEWIFTAGNINTSFVDGTQSIFKQG